MITRYTCCECYSNFYTMDSFDKHSNECKIKSADTIVGKTIKKMTWCNDGKTGIIIKLETYDGYVLSYSLGFDGDLIYLSTKDAG